MKPTDIYDLPYHFFRDVLGYWLPGLVLAVTLLGIASTNAVVNGKQVSGVAAHAGLAVAAEQPLDRALNSPVVAAFAEMGTASILFLAIAALAIGYASLPAGHALVKPLASWYMKKAPGCYHLRTLQDVRKLVGRAMIASLASAQPDGLGAVGEVDAWAIDKHVLYSYAQVEFPDTYRTLVPRHYALTLFHENLTFASLVIVVVAAVSGHIQLAAGAAASLLLNLWGALYYHRKREIAIQCLLIVASIKRTILNRQIGQ